MKLMKKLMIIAPALFSVCALGSCNKISPLPDDIPTSGYYKGFDFKLSGTKMLSQIHQFHFTKHKTYVLYSNINTYFNYTATRDSIEAPTQGKKQIEYFYTGKVTTEKKASGNREHVWPCANSAGLWTHSSDDGIHYVDGSNYKGGGSDLYHVRLANGSINTARGNSKFVDFDDFPDLKSQVKEYSEKDGKYKVLIQGAEGGEYGKKTEVDDHMKGDVARIILYVYTHYANIGTLEDKYQQYCGGLSLTSILGYDNSTAREKLAEWNRLDPPSETEKLRNDTVQKIQGNRNIFVDYPALVDRMFGFDQQ